MAEREEYTGSSSQILYYCYGQKSREGEQFVPHHVLSYTLTGNAEVYLDGRTYSFSDGDFHFTRRNQLARFVKYPPPGGEYRSVAIMIDEDTLRSIGKEQDLHMDQPYTGEGMLRLKPHPLLINYVESLKPYMNEAAPISKGLITLKAKEAIMLLLETNPVLKDVLFDFSAPGKIDLEAYMNGHFRFNVEMKRFAYLTGRSLATFKRDFEKIFHTSPSRWLQQRRLKEAWYLLKERGMKASDVYLEVGFEDLSHFSYSFKKTFGVPPSAVAPV
jgi:AraC-like DNA-binding protein